MSRGTREYDRQVAAALRRTAAERILLLDGAMGTEIQKRKPGEADYRGERFAAWPRDVKGNNDLLCLTRPDLVREIHRDYFAAGADLVETNTFNAQRISQADYGMEDLAVEINAAAAALARSAADEVEAATGVRRYVAGALGPTNRTLSLSPDVNNPGYRAVTFDEVRSAYAEQTRALIEGGADVLLVETIFDTLNAKAAIFAIEEVQEEMGREVPLMLSVTVTDASGRTLSGQTVGAFWTSVAHARPLSVGLNCALGAAEMRPYLEELAREADCLVSCYPNAGLPNAFGGYDETPEAFSSCLHGFAREGWLNIAGGCCGTGPEHIRRLSEMLRGVAPRRFPARRAVFRLSGLEALVVA